MTDKTGKLFMLIGECTCACCRNKTRVSQIGAVFDNGKKGITLTPEYFSRADKELALQEGVSLSKDDANICIVCGERLECDSVEKVKLIYLNDFTLDVRNGEEYYITV